MSRSGGPRVLVARRVDGWLVGWLAVLVWCGCFAVVHWGVGISSTVLTAVYWTGAVITAAHFGLSYHLAYSGGRPALRARPVALLAGPLVLCAVLGSIVVISIRSGGTSAVAITGALITSVYLMTTWHYVKQVYGIGRIGAAYAGISLATWDVRVLRYSLYPLWALGAAQVLIRHQTYNLAGFHYGFPVLPGGVLPVLRVLAVAAAVPVAVTFFRLRARTGQWPPSVLVAPYVATFLWIGLPPAALLTILLLAPFHALQYLAIGHRAEVAVAATRGTQLSVVWWLNIFAGAACAGLLLSRWLPGLLDDRLGTAGGPLLFAAAFFVFLNLHHYLIDASIWRSKGELVRAMVRKPDSVPAHPELGLASMSST
jgi:hypothetical protein